MNYSRQDTLRMQQQLLRQQLSALRWYEGGQPAKENVPAVLEQAGVPAALWGAKLSEYRDPAWAEEIDQWEERTRSGEGKLNLYIAGSRKLGKSYLCAAVLRKMALRKKVIGWRSWHGLVQAQFDRIHMSNLKGDEYDEALHNEVDERWMLYDVIQVLVIDDVQVMGTKDFILDEMYALLKHRTDYGLRTVMNGRPQQGDPPHAVKRFQRYRDEMSLVLSAGQ